MLLNSHGLDERGVFGRAVPLAGMPVIPRRPEDRAVFNTAEQRRLKAIQRRLFFQALVRCLGWCICVVLWVVAVLIWRAQV